MPELPEVETLKRELAKALVGRQIKTLEITWPKIIQTLNLDEFVRQIIGKKILAIQRRAKILILEISGEKFLLIHLKMTGQLIYQPKIGSKEKLIIGGHPEDPTKYTRVIINFADGSQLRFNDLRKFAWIRLVDKEGLEKLFDRHGPEPLDRKNFTLAHFEQILARYSKRKIKTLLLDQTLIAGLGNIYVDESCFLAKILPDRLSGTLSKKERCNLYTAIIEVLTLSIKKKGTSFRNYRRSGGQPGGFVPHLYVYGRQGEPCKRCETKIIKTKLNGRGTHFCPRCQK